MGHGRGDDPSELSPDVRIWEALIGVWWVLIGVWGVVWLAWTYLVGA